MRRSNKTIVLAIFGISLILQYILVALYNGVQISDYGYYVELAKQVADTGVMYPDANNIYCNYIQSPGYVNFLAIFFSLFGSVKSALYFNVILNMILGLEIFYLAKKYFSERTGYISLLLFSLYPSMYGIVAFTGSDLPFLVLTLAVIILYVRGKLWEAVAAGILAALANWVRPLLPVIIIICVMTTFLLIDRKKRIKHFTSFAGTLIAVILLLGIISEKRTGYFVYQSSTLGINMIMGANNDADGGYDDTVFKEGKAGYIPDINLVPFNKRDSVWSAQSILWIKDNPGEWLYLMPKKLFRTYCLDSYSVGVFNGNEEFIGNLDAKFYLDTAKSFPRWSFLQWIVVYNLAFYYLCLLLSLYGIYSVIKRRNLMGYILLVFWVLGTGICLVTVGGTRYHYPYIPIILIFAAYAIEYIINLRVAKSRELGNHNEKHTHNRRCGVHRFTRSKTAM